MNKLTILGSGTCMPAKNRMPSSFLLETSKTKLLIDCGFGAIARLIEIGVDPREIDGLFISHFHSDHFGDALNLIAARYVSNIYEHKKHKEIIIYGPKETKQRFSKGKEIFWPEPKEYPPIKFYEGSHELKLEDLQIKTFPIKHVPWFDSIGLRIKIGNKIIVYPGDVGSKHDIDDLIEKFDNADYLLIEPGYPMQTPNHFTLEQTEYIVKKANVKNVILIHLKPIQSEDARIRNFIRNKNNWIIAKDKMVINLLEE